VVPIALVVPTTFLFLLPTGSSEEPRRQDATAARVEARRELPETFEGFTSYITLSAP